MINLKKKAISLMSMATLATTTILVPVNTTVYAEKEPIKIEKGNQDDWTIGIYMCGADLESESYVSTLDFFEMLDAKVPENFSDNVNIVIQTGGARKWHFKEEYATKLLREGFSEEEINQIIPKEIDEGKIQEYKINFQHKYRDDEGKIKTIPALEFIKDVADYSDYEELTEEDVNDPGFTSMGNQKYLESFINDLNKNFPSEHRMLEFYNHGGGITGGVCYDENAGDDCLTLKEILSALDNTKSDELGKFDIIGYDACLMSNYETFNHLSAYAKNAVGSLTAEPGEGWYYTSFIEDLGKNYNNEKFDGRELSSSIVEAYKDFYKTNGIVDEMMNEGSVTYYGSNFYDDAVLAAVDLEKLNKTIPTFNELSDNLIKLYGEREGTDFIRKEMEKAVVFYNCNISGFDKFLDIIIENANNRIKKIEGSNEGFDPHTVELYKLEKQQAEKLKEDIKKSVINSYNGREGNRAEDLGAMSIFYPDYMKTSSKVALFTLDEYPEYSLNGNYTLYTYYTAYENGAIINDRVKAQMNLDTKKNIFTIGLPEKEALYSDIKGEKFIEKDGKYYDVMQLPADIGINVRDYTVKYKLHDFHFEMNGVPIAVVRMGGLMDVGANSFVTYICDGELNGKIGIFSFAYDDTSKKYIINYFMDAENEEIINVKAGDTVGFAAETYNKLDRNFVEGEPEIKMEKYVMQKSNFIEIDGENACVLPLNEVKDNNANNVTYYFAAIHDYAFVLAGEKNVEDIDMDIVTFNYSKYNEYANAKVSISNDKFELTGEKIEPAILFDGKADKFVKGVDYEVTYENNLGLGRAKATIKGLGAYALLPEKYIEFDIVKAKVVTVEGKEKVVYKTIVVNAPNKAYVKSVKNAKKKSLKVSWKKVKGVAGYEVVIARNKKFTKGKKVKTVKSGKKASLTIKKLKEKTYFVKVRAYTLDTNGKKVYGDWSKVKSVKIKR